MTYLIDTQILIWFQANSKDLKPIIRSLLVHVENQIFVSTVSLYEIAIKQKINKLPEFPASINDILTVANQDGFQILPIYSSHVVSYDDIPLMADHRDWASPTRLIDLFSLLLWLKIYQLYLLTRIPAFTCLKFS